MKIPAITLEFWNSLDTPGVTADEIAEVEALAGGPLPADYKRFLRDHGFVEWDIDLPDSFTYGFETAGQTVQRTAYVSHLEPLRNMRNFAKFGRADDPDNGLPRIPPTHFPIAGTPGQDMILMETAPKPGRIWFWPARQDPWGSGDNTDLGFVADSFTAFIEGLRLADD